MRIRRNLLLILILSLTITLTGCPGPSQSDGPTDTDVDDNIAVDQPEDGPDSQDGAVSSDSEEISLMDLSRGLAVWKSSNCVDCHTIGDDPGGDTGPDLTGVGDRYTKAELKSLLESPHGANPDAQMPAAEVTGDDLEYLARYLSLLSSELRKE